MNMEAYVRYLLQLSQHNSTGESKIDQKSTIQKKPKPSRLKKKTFTKR